jgi:hypothetical protein
MLKANHPFVRRFKQHALEERQRALESSSLRIRDEHFASERWWLKLAESYDFSTRLDRLLDVSVPRHPACPVCVAPMRLVEIQSFSGRLECVFECRFCDEKVAFTQIDH